MKKFKFKFNGRQTGAIGIFYDISQEYEAKTLNEAVQMLWYDYEHFSKLTLNGKPFKTETHHLEPNVIRGYKGLGIKRK